MNDNPATPPGNRRLWPLLIGIAALIGVMQYAKTPNLPPVNCDTDVAADAVDVVMLSASWCGYCARARQMFIEDEISYCEYDVEKTTTGANLYMRSGLRGVPVIYVGDNVFSGFNRHEITQALVADDIVSFDAL